MGLALGPRPAGLAHRVLGDGRGAPRAGRSRSTAAGSTSSSRTTRTRSRSRARSGTSSRRSGCTTGCSGLAGEKMSKSLGNIVTLRDAIDKWGRETLLVYFLGGALAQADRLLGRGARAGGRAAPRASATSSDAEPAPAGEWEPFAAALDDDFNTPEALAVMHGWRDHELLAPRARGLRARVARRERGGAGRARRACARSASRPGPQRDFDEADRLRAEIEARRLGGARRRGRAGLPARPEAVTPRPRLRAPPRARGAARAAGGARALGDRARAEGRAVARGDAASGSR